jgi:Fe-Mn family superoxide dismutase
MPIELPQLPYSHDALEPFISARTLQTHHGKHHRAYVDKANALIGNGGGTLEEIIARAADDPSKKALFNNAAQAWNHAFFWNSLRPPVPGGGPLGALRDRMDVDFGGVEGFAAAFKEAAAGVFGSGWAWLVREGDALSIVTTGNADTPILHGQLPLLVLDVWEHSYYLDYQSRRPAYVSAVVDHLLNWEFAELNFEGELALHA